MCQFKTYRDSFSPHSNDFRVYFYPNITPRCAFVPHNSATTQVAFYVDFMRRHKIYYLLEYPTFAPWIIHGCIIAEGCDNVKAFCNKLGMLPSLSEVVRNYLTCGDLENGFARVRCGDCSKEYLLAFSCKGWYSNKSRGLREKQGNLTPDDQPLSPITPHHFFPFPLLWFLILL